jgi:DnaJ-class molecular chaperone
MAEPKVPKVKCPTCGGRGQVVVGSEHLTPYSRREKLAECPTCRGAKKVPRAAVQPVTLAGPPQAGG